MVLKMNVKKIHVVALFSALTWIQTSPAAGEFSHPGIAHSHRSIEFVKTKVAAGEQPWLSAWEGLKNSRHASLDWQPKPFSRVERGPYNDPDIGSSEFSGDARAAYYHALSWAISGEVVHAKKAAEIINAWSSTLQEIGNHDAKLLIGMSGYNFCIGGELLKHTWDDWPEDEQTSFASMLRTIWYPIIKDFLPSANGNWDASMLQVMMAMGVFLDDQEMFDRAENYFLSGAGNGAIGNYFKESGQCQESGRDQGHTQMGLEYLANTCETAWIQGVDLYGALDNRLLKGFEYTAKYNLGFDVPYVPYESFQGRYFYEQISDEDRGRLRPMYERVYNHYGNRLGLAAPYTKQALLKLRSVQPVVRDSRENQEVRGDREGRAKRRGRRGRRRRNRPAYLDTLMYANQPATIADPGLPDTAFQDEGN